jgi:Ca2+-binding RTX toxin-like protein
MSLVVRAGDGNDRVRMPRRRVPYRRGVRTLNTRATTLRGGAGDDRLSGPGELIGGSGADRLDGSANEDWLLGGAGEDHLKGGGDRDELRGDDSDFGAVSPPSSIADDWIDGGPGIDEISFDTREEPVVLDLLAGVAGQAGELDRVTRVEDATGGGGTDTLLGDDGPNYFFDGGGGGGEMQGHGGDDVLIATDARLISGGSGDDTLVPGALGIDSPTPPELDCGPGDDAVETDDTYLAPLLVVPRGCEYATNDEFELSLRPRQSGPGVLIVELWTIPVSRSSRASPTEADRGTGSDGLDLRPFQLHRFGGAVDLSRRRLKVDARFIDGAANGSQRTGRLKR